MLTTISCATLSMAPRSSVTVNVTVGSRFLVAILDDFTCLFFPIAKVPGIGDDLRVVCSRRAAVEAVALGGLGDQAYLHDGLRQLGGRDGRTSGVRVLGNAVRDGQGHAVYTRCRVAMRGEHARASPSIAKIPRVGLDGLGRGGGVAVKRNRGIVSNHRNSSFTLFGRSTGLSEHK
jgi:hypothetical protein